MFCFQDPTATTPSKGSKKEKKDKKKRGEKAVNGDDGENDRASPEINTQEQMAAQRASGGAIDAPPPEVVTLKHLNFYHIVTSSFYCNVLYMYW